MLTRAPVFVAVALLLLATLVVAPPPPTWELYRLICEPWGRVSLDRSKLPLNGPYCTALRQQLQAGNGAQWAQFVAYFTNGAGLPRGVARFEELTAEQKAVFLPAHLVEPVDPVTSLRNEELHERLIRVRPAPLVAVAGPPGQAVVRTGPPTFVEMSTKANTVQLLRQHLQAKSSRRVAVSTQAPYRVQANYQWPTPPLPPGGASGVLARAAVAAGNVPNHITDIPYCWDTTAAGPNGWATVAEKDVILRGMQEIVANCPQIQFSAVVCGYASHKIRLVKNSINDASSSMGWFSNGVAGSFQDLTLDPAQYNSFSAAHELLHNLGFSHTHERADRLGSVQMNPWMDSAPLIALTQQHPAGWTFAGNAANWAIDGPPNYALADVFNPDSIMCYGEYPAGAAPQPVINPAAAGLVLPQNMAAWPTPNWEANRRFRPIPVVGPVPPALVVPAWPGAAVTGQRNHWADTAMVDAYYK